MFPSAADRRKKIISMTLPHREGPFSLTPRFIAVTARPYYLFNRFNGLFAVRGQTVKTVAGFTPLDVTAMNRGVNEVDVSLTHTTRIYGGRQSPPYQHRPRLNDESPVCHNMRPDQRKRD